MRIKIDASHRGPALFLTSANQPTQVAYGLSVEDVLDSFIVALLANPIVLLAGSYFFESAATRHLVRTHPHLFAPDPPRAIFFINSEYPSFTEHGLGKREKSPTSFDSYAYTHVVKRRGKALDQLGVTGTRSDVDISEALVSAWINSCHSDDPASLLTLIRQTLPATASDSALLHCISLADRGRYDFVWPTISPYISQNELLSPLSDLLQRKLADLYAEVMSITLGAVETTPSIASEGPAVSQRSIGHLGIYQRVLAHLGVDIPRLRDDMALAQLLSMPELDVVRSIHRRTIEIANDLQDDFLDFWRALELAEQQTRFRRLSHSQMKRAITSAFVALGLTPDDSYIRSVAHAERLLDNRFVNHFRSTVEQMMLQPSARSRRRHPRKPPVMPRDVLLFASADPPGAGVKLALDRELKEIRRALDSLHDKCILDLVYEPAFEAADLQMAVQKNNPRFFHFSGHGTQTGEIIVEGKKTPDFIRIGPIVRALNLISTKIECVVFNSCFSESGLAAIGKKVEYSILMSDAIGDEAAIRFAASFYSAIGAGIAIRKAFAIACNAIDLFNLPQSDVPRLYRQGKRVTKI